MIKVCPKPECWAGIYEKLMQHHEKKGGAREDEPPMCLVLEGWLYTNAAEKHARWIETQEWAAQHGCAELTAVPGNGWYCVAEMPGHIQGSFEEGL